MLNLQLRHGKTRKIILAGAIVVVSLSMLTYLVPSVGGSSQDVPAVAIVAGGEVTAADVSSALQNVTAGSQLPAGVVSGLVPTVVQRLVTARALAYEAQHIGIRVSDADVREAIRFALPQLYPSGQFLGKQAYAQLLAQQNETIPQFEAEIRDSRLLEEVDASVIVTPQEVEAAYRHSHQRFRLLWVKVTSDRFRAASQPSAAEIASWFQAHRASFQTPESRSLTILLADRRELAQSLVPSDSNLRALYQKNLDRYRVSESVDFRQIVLPQGDPQAASIVQQLRAGADFAALAAKYSIDSAAAQHGGEYRGVERGQLAPALDTVVFSLPVGHISDPVATGYGEVVVEVEKHQPAGVRPFAEVRGDLAQEWREQQAAAKMDNIAAQVPAALRAAPQNVDSIAARYEMQPVSAPAYRAGAVIPEIGPAADFYQAVANLLQGGVSDALPLPGYRLAVVAVNSISPARPETLAEARGRIVDILTQTRAQDAARKQAQKLFDRAQSMHGDFAAAAHAMGVAVQTSDMVERSADVPGLGALAVLDNAFDWSQGSLFGPVDEFGGIVLGKIVEEQRADMAAFPAEAGSIRESLRSQRVRTREQVFEAGLLQRLPKAGKLRENQTVIHNLEQNVAS